MSENILKLDLRELPVFQRHPSIFEAWENLEAGQILQLTNDHDPKPLRYQFEGEQKGAFTWEYVLEGPAEWVVNIKKLPTEKHSLEGLSERVNEALSEIRPYLQADGGDVELVDADEASGVVRVRLTGACGGCPSAEMTLKAGVERTVRKYAPGVKRVEAV